MIQTRRSFRPMTRRHRWWNASDHRDAFGGLHSSWPRATSARRSRSYLKKTKKKRMSGYGRHRKCTQKFLTARRRQDHVGVLGIGGDLGDPSWVANQGSFQLQCFGHFHVVIELFRGSEFKHVCCTRRAKEKERGEGKFEQLKTILKLLKPLRNVRFEEEFLKSDKKIFRESNNLVMLRMMLV